jgi:hypothetical protein
MNYRFKTNRIVEGSSRDLKTNSSFGTRCVRETQALGP